jgi:hypothetical protein
VEDSICRTKQTFAAISGSDSACRLISILPNFAAEIHRASGGPKVFARWFHSTCRQACVAVCLLAAISAMSGCSFWYHAKEKVTDSLNMDKYRDERAADIDRRLSSPEPIVKNPF